MKVMHYALMSKFGTESVDKIMEVVCATPNPEMAVEILLGIYEETKLESVVVYRGVKGQEQFRTLMSVDFWKNEVHYQYNAEITKYIYIHKDTDRSLITPENYTEFVLKHSDEDSVGYYLLTGEIETRTSYCTISEWQGYSKPVEL